MYHFLLTIFSAFLPLLFIILSFLLFLSLKKDNRGLSTLAEALIGSLVTTGLVVTIITEILSLADTICFPAITAAWFIADAAMLYLCTFLAKRKPGCFRFPPQPNLSSMDLLSLCGMATLAIALLVIALICPPNTWDSMTYHLGRIIHWMQNENLNPYPTHITRQLHMSPWAEQAIMHMQLLTSSDRFANVIQWIAMCGSIIGVTLIARMFGAKRSGQILTAILCMSIPMGILQATSTQNDYVVSLWLVTFVYYCLQLQKKTSIQSAFGVGASLGLAILTKSTAYLFAFPIILWTGFHLLRKMNRKIIMLTILAGTIALLINTPHLTRNIKTYGSPFGPSAENKYEYTNEMHTLPLIFSNILRNMAIHIGTPTENLNILTRKCLGGVHRLMGLDLNDPRITWKGECFNVTEPSYHETTQGNCIHILLIFFSFLMLPVLQKRHRINGLTGYSLSFIAGAILFSIILRWQPWHSRLHLPLFILCSPIIATNLTTLLKKNLTPYIVGIILLLSTLPWILHNKTKPLIHNSIFNQTREQMYFNARPKTRNAHTGAADFLGKQSNISNVGLILEMDDWEYPLLPLLQKRGMTPHLEHIRVHNKTAHFATSEFHPDAIFTTQHRNTETFTLQNRVFIKAWSLDGISVFLPTD